MTTLVREEIRCGLCGQANFHQVVASTNQFGSPDLDLRPPEMARSTMRYWLQHCQSCGLVASNLTAPEDGTQQVLTSSDYRSAACDSSMPELARLFVCRSLIEEALGQFREAFSRRLAAAWVCDDAKLSQLARKCREEAAALLQESAELSGEDRLRLLDVLRRTGNWEEAERLGQDLSAEQLDEQLLQIVGFQQVLIKNRDDSCHSMQEVFAQVLPPPPAVTESAPPPPKRRRSSLFRKWWRRGN